MIEMDFEARKLEVIQRFLSLADEELVSQLEAILLAMEENKFLPMSIETLQYRIQQSEADFKAGNYKSSEQLLDKFS